MCRQSLATVSLPLQIIAVPQVSMTVCQSLKSSCKQSLFGNFRSLEGATISDLSIEMDGCVGQTSLYEVPRCSEFVRKCSIPHNSHCPKINVGMCFLSQWKANLFCFLLLGCTNHFSHKPLQFVTSYLPLPIILVRKGDAKMPSTFMCFVPFSIMSVNLPLNSTNAFSCISVLLQFKLFISFTKQLPLTLAKTTFICYYCL